ncbi:hypothetical protein Droror1_Dr00017362 [Drosera rotundifolia]
MMCTSLSKMDQNPRLTFSAEPLGELDLEAASLEVWVLLVERCNCELKLQCANLGFGLVVFVNLMAESCWQLLGCEYEVVHGVRWWLRLGRMVSMMELLLVLFTLKIE